jgi:hypothetical protein
VNGWPPAPEVALSYGMGADSTAVLLRWLAEPATCPCDLDGLLVVTAMTGDEWPVTGRLVTEHILPRLREHRVRYAQVARAGPVQADGIAVLDDSRGPRRLHLAGAFRLSDELRAAGTVPQVAGVRKCSLKAKVPCTGSRGGSNDGPSCGESANPLREPREPRDMPAELRRNYDSEPRRTPPNPAVSRG